VTIGEILVYLLVAFLCGLAGQLLAGSTLGGKVVSTLVGLAGAVVGGALARAIDAPEPFSVIVGGHEFPLLWSIVGAAIVTFGVAYMRRETRANKT
jgi:uncharacterized membrane protein YeaQ/YmgE (transglycosylase-associated protein family)